MQSKMPISWIRVGRVEEVREKRIVVVTGGEVPIAVVAHDGRISAIDNRCPHMGFPLHKGTVKDGILTCHWHEARFDLQSGCTFDLWADDGRVYDTRIEDNVVYVAAAPRHPADAAYHRRRLRLGLEQNIGLLQAKSLLGLLDSGEPFETILREVAQFASQNRDSWGPGLTRLTIVARLRPWLTRETLSLALCAAVREVARDCSNMAARRPRDPLDDAGYSLDTLKRWLRHWTLTRQRDAAERTLLTALTGRPSADRLTDFLASAACDRPYAAGGHLFDFLNKAFELWNLLGADSGAEVFPLVMEDLVRSRGGEESAHWHQPVDVVGPLRAVNESLPSIMKGGAGKTWKDNGSLTEILLGDDPLAIIEALQQALSKGAPAVDLSRRVAYAAALRLARFAVTNDVGDWFNPQHTFIYVNAVHQTVKRSPTPDVVRAIFHGAIAVYMDRFLNVPPARLPGESGELGRLPSSPEELREALLSVLDQRSAIDEAARLVVRWVRCSHPVAGLIDSLAYATVREDLDFHSMQVLEAGVMQVLEWEGRPEAEAILVGVARSLAASCPTRRAGLQTATIALRLHRKEKVYE